jgi:phage terminase Nu1 subunit (DNA packaging protein)
MNDLMTRFTLAQHFQVSERTIERWEDRGMPVIIIGKVHRYDYSKVMEWVALQETVKGITS